MCGLAGKIVIIVGIFIGNERGRLFISIYDLLGYLYEVKKQYNYFIKSKVLFVSG